MKHMFEHDRKRAAQLTKRVLVDTGCRKPDAIRKAVDKVAGSKSLEYRQDLFSVVRETWHLA